MSDIYIHSTEIHNTDAAKVIVPIINKFFNPRSVLDIGCGLGTWIRIFQDYIQDIDILGIDGNHLDKSKLVIDQSNYKEADLRYPLILDRKFDLALCLEVAEHLPESSADTLVESLCSNSETIIFSAAIPGQGGQNHLNEQWPEYWATKFSHYGYDRYDLIRPLVWQNSEVDFWYKQNIFVFSKKEIKAEMQPVLAEIHPDLWELKIGELNKSIDFQNKFESGNAGIKASFFALLNAIKRKVNLK